MSSRNISQIKPQIYDLLNNLGANAAYVGFFQTAYAVYLVTQQPERLLLITKWLYPDVAKHYSTNWFAVERNIRTIAHLSWTRCPKKLIQLAGYELDRAPTNTQFISMLAVHLLRSADIAASCPILLCS